MRKSYKIVLPGHVFPLAWPVVDSRPGGVVEKCVEHLAQVVRSLRIVITADDDHLDWGPLPEPLDGLRDKGAALSKGVKGTKHLILNGAGGGRAAEVVGVVEIVADDEQEFRRFEAAGF